MNEKLDQCQSNPYTTGILCFWPHGRFIRVNPLLNLGCSRSKSMLEFPPKYQMYCRNIFRRFKIFQIFSGAFKYSKYLQVLDQQPKLGAAWMETVNPEFLLLRWHQIVVALSFDQTKYLWLLILIRTNICGFWSDRIFVAFSFDQTKYLYLLFDQTKYFWIDQKPHLGFFFWGIHCPWLRI